MQVVGTRALKTAIMQALIDHALAGPFSGPLDGVKIGLYTNVGLVLNDLTDLSVLTEPTFTGYARSAGVAWGTIFYDAAGVCTVELATGVLFQLTAVTGGMATATGVFAVDSAGTVLLFAGNLDTPVKFINPGDGYEPPLQWQIVDPPPFASQGA